MGRKVAMAGTFTRDDLEAAGRLDWLDDDGNLREDIPREEILALRTLLANRYVMREDGSEGDYLMSGLRGRKALLNCSHKIQYETFVPLSHPGVRDAQLVVLPMHIVRPGDGSKGVHCGCTLLDLERLVMKRGTNEVRGFGKPGTKDFDVQHCWVPVIVKDEELEEGITAQRSQVMKYANTLMDATAVENFIDYVTGRTPLVLNSGKQVNGGRPFVCKDDITELQAWAKNRLAWITEKYKKGITAKEEAPKPTPRYQRHIGRQ